MEKQTILQYCPFIDPWEMSCLIRTQRAAAASMRTSATNLAQLPAVFRIRIRIDLALLDPDPCWECGFRTRRKEKENLLTNWFPAFQIGFCAYVGMFFDLLTYLK
jgi:hypothetical protein